jgi:hypothetical protein
MEDARSFNAQRTRRTRTLDGSPDFRLAAPTPDHFLPLAYVAGVASADGQPQFLVDWYAMESLSMTCYTIGASVTVDPHEREDAPPAALRARRRNQRIAPRTR